MEKTIGLRAAHPTPIQHQDYQEVVAYSYHDSAAFNGLEFLRFRYYFKLIFNRSNRILIGIYDEIIFVYVLPCVCIWVPPIYKIHNSSRVYRDN